MWLTQFNTIRFEKGELKSTVRGSLTYTSWNIKQLSDRVVDSVAVRTGATPRKYKWSHYTLTDGTPMARLHARIIAQQVSDVCAVMEGVISYPSAQAAAVAIQTNFAAVDTLGHSLQFSISDLSGALRADRYLVFFRQQTVDMVTPPGGNTFNFPINCPGYPSAALPVIDRYPVRFIVREKASSNQEIYCFLWHAPQPAHTLGAATISQIAQFVRDTENDATLAFAATHIIISGDFNIPTGLAAQYASLVAPTIGTIFSSQFSGQLTTMRASAATKLPGATTVGDQLMSGNFNAALKSPFDDILVKTATLTPTGTIRINLAEWAIEYIKDLKSITTPMITRMVAENAMILGNEISDHIPVGVGLDII